MGTLTEYRARPHWSYSSVNGFVNICSLQWAFSHILKLERDFTPLSLSFGSTFHRTLEWIGMIRMEGNVPDKDESTDLFHTLWTRQIEEDGNIRFDEGTDAESCSAQGRDMIGCIIDNLDPDEQVIAVNEAFCVPLVDMAGNVLEKPLIGEIDTVVEKDGIRHVVDWKTSANRWPKKKAGLDLQPTAFLYAYSALHDELPDFRFDVVVKNKKPVFTQHTTQRTDDHFYRFVEMVKLVESMVEHEHFMPSEQGFYCGNCQYHGACKSWHRDRARCMSLAA